MSRSAWRFTATVIAAGALVGAAALPAAADGNDRGYGRPSSYSGVVLGGMGSILGAFWGGLTVGFVQQFSALILPPQLQNAAIFVVFLMIVLLRPQGLFGRSAERA